MFLTFYNVRAQHDHSSHDHGGSAEHSHKADPPHGGEIKDVGKYHLEIVFDVSSPTEKMNIYVLKSNLKTLAVKGALGSISIKYKDGTEVNYELINDGGDRLYCDVKDVVNAFNSVIRIRFNGKELNCAYFYKGVNK